MLYNVDYILRSGSNPEYLTYVPVAQLDRALACGARGRKFESCRVHQLKLLRKP
jgi:hypothetical protein